MAYLPNISNNIFPPKWKHVDALLKGGLEM